MSLFLVYLIIPLLSSLIKADSSIKVENIFPQNVTVHPGDVLQCEITKTNIEETKNNYHIMTKACTDECYVYQPVTEKCFSFQVKAAQYACIELSNISDPVSSYRLEVILEAGKSYSCIRQATSAGTNFLSKLDHSGIVNDREYNGFWIRWLDDVLLEVGRESETVPFLQYRFPQKLQINFVGFYTWKSKGAWIIHTDPKCPGRNGTAVERKSKAESECFLLT